MFQKITFIVLIFISVSGFTQEQVLELSLEEAISIGLENNLDVKSSELRESTSELEFKQTRNSRLPNLNANYNYGLNNGRSIDPFTNSYIDEELNFSNAGLNLGLNLFNGFELRNRIQRDRFNMEASEMEVQQARQEMVLNVTLAYFQVLNNTDLLELAKTRRIATLDQLERLETLNEEGEGNPANYTDIRGQLANDDASITDALNNLKASKLELRRLLNIEADLVVVAGQFDMEPSDYEFSADEVFNESLENLATFKAGELRIEAAKENVQVSRSLYAPEISLFAQLNTNYSSLARLFNETGASIVETGEFVNVGDNSYSVMEEQTNFMEEQIPYQDQLINNLNSNIGVSLSIPIFNGFRAKNTVALRKIELEEQKVAYQRTKNEFEQAIREAYSDMKTALNRYSIYKEQVSAYSESFRVNEIRFNSGVSNIVEYIISKNNLDNARINLSNARYEYVFRTKILDYYRGLSI
ncbi:TolC family protein [Salegentibacter sp. LM13S]|uniref:TolC family protein n=1 Tax=Salegentibacter lacus TaxID=2873599 RepID=UPI001CC9B237|nr:TolC family protein [Salegentibacter lacus]MBZ9629726.1 TolC family protein [Salegentibacter lacus]